MTSYAGQVTASDRLSPTPGFRWGKHQEFTDGGWEKRVWRRGGGEEHWEVRGTVWEEQAQGEEVCAVSR